MKKFLILFYVLSFVLIFPSFAIEPGDTVWTKKFPSDYKISHVEFSPDDSLIAVIISLANVKVNPILIKTTTGEIDKELIGLDQWGIESGTFSLDGRYFIASALGLDSLKYNCIVWDVETGDIIKKLDIGFDTTYIPSICGIYDINFTPDGEKLYAVRYMKDTISPFKSIGAHIMVWSTNNWELEKTKEKTNIGFSGLKISPDGKYYATRYYSDHSNEKGIILWDINTDTLFKYFSFGNDQYIEDIKFSNDGKYITAGNAMDTLRIFNVETGVYHKKIYFPNTGLSDFTFTPNNGYLVISSYDKIDNKNLKILSLNTDSIVYSYDYWTSFNDISSDSLLILSSTQDDLYLYRAKYEVTSIFFNDNDEENILFPNPASDFIYINLDSPSIKTGLESVFEIRIWDVFGEKVVSTPFNSPASGGQVRIDLSGLATGMYFVRIGAEVHNFVKL